jgi:hypothetical protein
MRVEVAEAASARELVDALQEIGPVVLNRHLREVLLLWPCMDADDLDEWDEQTFAELVFFLRAWSNRDPGRAITVLEERPLDVPERIFRLAS